MSKRKNQIANPNPNPTQNKQKELHVIAGLFNVCHDIFKGVMQIDVFGKRKFKGTPTSKAYIDATKKTVRSTAKGHGEFNVNDDTVDFGGYIRIIESLPDPEKK